MPAVPAALAALVLSNVDSRMAAVNGFSPLAAQNPSYFTAMCMAIGKGVIQGGPVISFTTVDTGLMGIPPVPGVGAGVGITTDPSFFIQDLYTRARGYVIADFGKTSHDPFPPGPTNSGQYLLALCKGINDAIMTYYPTAWTLVSAHPTIYQGVGLITNGNFSGLSASAIKSTIVGLAPQLVGPFWPRLAQAVSESYVALIQQHSTGTVTITGVCVPGITQVCAVPSVGSGSGTAT